MNKFQYLSMRRQYDRIIDHFDSDLKALTCDDIIVVNAKPHDLDTTPYTEQCIGSIVDILNLERAAIFGKNMNHISDIAAHYRFDSNYAYDQAYEDEGETFAEALLGLNDARYIALFKQGYNTINHVSTKRWKLIIFDLVDLNIQQEIQKRIESY